jgi:hypothetical protein
MFAALAPAQPPNAAAPAIPAPSAPWAPATKPAPPGSRPPNVVLVLIDDLGYGDIGPYGGSTPTPNLDRLAKEGRRFTDFSVSSAVCSASRAAILTGCVHERVGIRGALGPDATHGLAAAEQTIAELLRARGYATACFGTGMRLREDGVLIQNAFPTLSPVQREFLMTGMSEDEQAEFFAGEES